MVEGKPNVWTFICCEVQRRTKKCNSFFSLSHWTKVKNWNWTLRICKSSYLQALDPSFVHKVIYLPISKQAHLHSDIFHSQYLSVYTSVFVCAIAWKRGYLHKLRHLQILWVHFQRPVWNVGALSPQIWIENLQALSSFCSRSIRR